MTEMTNDSTTEPSLSQEPQVLKPEAIREIIWDACVVGNGASALWSVHHLRSQGRSVLWVSGEEPSSVERAVLKHGWNWSVSQDAAQALFEKLGVDQTLAQPLPFEAVYFDAKSSKRFRRLAEVKPEWGEHEIPVLSDFFQAERLNNTVDLAQLQSTLSEEYGSVIQTPPQPGRARLLRIHAKPAVVLAQGFLLLGVKTKGTDEIESLSLAGKIDGDTETNFEIRATEFVLGDFGESFAAVTEDTEAAERLRTPWKGRSYRAGFSIEFYHRGLNDVLTQTAVIPLVANPSKKGAGSHVVGRFLTRGGQVESVWYGLLTDEELEDNNEILKKMKSAKRAIERAIPGFLESVIHETVTFEPHMCAIDLVKRKSGNKVLGATIVTDVFGPEAAIQHLP